MPSLFDDPDVTYRASMLPMATYRNPNGGPDTLGWALPSMITEPINALQRLAQNSLMPDGSLGIPNEQNLGNQHDVSLLLQSLTGGNAMNPRRLMEGAAAHAAEVPAATRMYHGTGVPEDFSTFTPSERGALGPGVYLSRDPAVTDPYAFNGPNPRVMPVDVTGPLATHADYLAARANGEDQASAIRTLLDQGFSGVSANFDSGGGHNFTNMFKPGTVRSATTGETLFSDQMPPLFGGILAQGSDNQIPTDPWAHRDQPPVEDYQSVQRGLNQWRDEQIDQLRAKNPGMNWIDAYDKVIQSQEFKDRSRSTSKHIPFSDVPDFIPHR